MAIISRLEIRFLLRRIYNETNRGRPAVSYVTGTRYVQHRVVGGERREKTPVHRAAVHSTHTLLGWKKERKILIHFENSHETGINWRAERQRHSAPSQNSS